MLTYCKSRLQPILHYRQNISGVTAPVNTIITKISVFVLVRLRSNHHILSDTAKICSSAFITSPHFKHLPFLGVCVQTDLHIGGTPHIHQSHQKFHPAYIRELKWFSDSIHLSLPLNQS